MQTFLPYADYDQSAEALDPSRLGNQCYREGKTLVGGGWPNHPASKMWRPYMYSLCEYCKCLAVELIVRGHKAVGRRWWEWFRTKQSEFENTGEPWWLGNEEFHASHRSNLLRKDPIWYGQFGWTESDDLPYIWPVDHLTKGVADK